MKRIVITGGGTAGHVTPNIALFPALKEAGYDIQYIGSYTGMEKGLIENEKIPYHGIDSGKLRRYFDLKNFSDPFRVLHGYFQARRILRKLKPNVVFSKGGFVSVPVVLAAKSLRIPAIIHESDITPGLANKIAMKGAAKVCCNFPETMKYLPSEKAVLTGSPIRQELLHGSKEKALEFTGLNDELPIILVMGGSLGAKALNKSIRKSLKVLLEDFQIIHLCGKGNLDTSLENIPGYVQYEYISKELPDLFVACDLVVSRAGANAICELLALNKPNILIPLPKSQSRGDQILNAESFRRQGFSTVLDEDTMTDNAFVAAIRNVYEKRLDIIDVMRSAGQTDSVRAVVSLIEDQAVHGQLK